MSLPNPLSVIEELQPQLRTPQVRDRLVKWLASELKSSDRTRLEKRRDQSVRLTDIVMDLRATAAGARHTEDDAQRPWVIAELLEREPWSQPPAQERAPGPEDQPDGPCWRGGTLLIAGPGQGKSTLSHYLAQIHRSALLRDFVDKLGEDEREILAAMVEAPAIDPELPAPVEVCVPARIELPRFSTWMERERRGEVKGALLDYLHGLLELELEDIQALLSATPWLLVLDGLDEVISAPDHARVTAAINDLYDQLCQWSARFILVVTTRPQNYGDQLAQRFESRVLCELDSKRGLAYAEVLIGLFHEHEPESQSEAMAQLRAAYDDEAVKRLLTTPLQVSIMAQLVDEIGEPPRDRWRLFSEYQNVLVNRERRRAAELFKQHYQLIEAVLRHLGLLLQTMGERSGAAQAFISAEQLEQVILEHLAREEIPELDSRDLAKRIEQVALERLVFLVPAGAPGHYCFELRSLQEFMAAKALTDGSEQDVEARLEAIANVAAWRNVLLFAVARIFVERTYLRDMVIRLCEQLNDAQSYPLSGALLGGSALALTFLREGVISSPKYKARLAALAARLLELPFGEVHPELARASAELEVLQHALEPELRAEWPTEPGLQMSRWCVLGSLCDQGLEWAITIGEQRWPSTSEAQRRTLTALSHGGTRDWAQKQFERNIASIDPRDIGRITRRWWRKHRATWTPPADFHCFQRRGSIFLNWQSTSVGLSTAIRPVNSGYALRPKFLEQLLRHPTHHPGWLPLLDTRDFIERPSAKTLAASLRKLSSRSIAPSSFRWWSHRFPWPLAGFLEITERHEQLLEWADAVENGDYGDIDAWLAQEQEWRANPDFDIRKMMQSWPLWNSIGLSKLFARHTPNIIVECATQQDSSSYARLLEVAKLELRVREMRERQLPLDAPALAHVLEDVYTARHFVELLGELLGDTSDETVKAAMELVKRREHWNPAGTSHVQPEHIASALRILQSSPSLESLLNLLAQLALDVPWMRGTSPPVGVSDYTNPDAQRDALILHINAASSLDVVVDLLRTHAQLSEDDDFSRVWLGTARLSEHTDWSEPTAQAQLYAAIPPTAFVYAWSLDIDETFRERLGAFPSRLDEESRWLELGLESPTPADFAPSPSATKSVSPAQPKLPATLSAIAPTQLHLQNLRAFEDFSLPRLPPAREGEGRWLVLLGENGLGKSTLLRALALTLADPSLVPQLVDGAPAWRRDPNKAAQINLTLGTHQDRTHWAQITAKDGRERGEASKNGSLRPFVYAYGCARGTATSSGGALQDDSRFADVRTLFDDSARLEPAAVWLNKLATSARPSHDSAPQPGALELFESVRKTIVDMLPGVEALEVEGEPLFSGPDIGENIPLGALSDGYITTVGWVVDLLARWVRRARERGEPLGPNFNRRMRGVVLIDELDLHLHPSWQHRIIADIREVFPAMHFVVTTHNPMTLLSARRGEIIRLTRGENGQPHAALVDYDPRLATGTELYAEFFGIDRLYPSKLGEQLQRYSELAINPLRTDDEEREVQELRATLEDEQIELALEPVPRESLH